MISSRKRYSTGEEIREIENNPQSDLSLEDKLLVILDCISMDAADEDLPAERKKNKSYLRIA